jgi:hypothetical protein
MSGQRALRLGGAIQRDWLFLGYAVHFRLSGEKLFPCFVEGGETVSTNVTDRTGFANGVSVGGSERLSVEGNYVHVPSEIECRAITVVAGGVRIRIALSALSGEFCPDS